jgi:signal transduction histidine kinase
VPEPVTVPSPDAPPTGPGGEASPEFLGELLRAEVWQEALEKYARAMHLAVALVDAGGRLLGPCLNPQPLWALFRARRPAGASECPFALAPPRPCTCAADALSRGGVDRDRDRTGLVHFAVPLTLGGQRLGALLAGQVFDHYPEQLELEHAARHFGLSPGQVWEKARLEHPVSPPALRVYEELLATLGRSFLQARAHALREAERLAERRRAEEALRRAHEELERRVEERTAQLRAAQHKALQAERLAAIGQMAAGLAHEGRNALQRAQACLQRLRFRLEGQPECLDLLARMQAAQDDLHRLYEDVREYAAPIRLDARACDLRQVWREAWEELAPDRDGRQAELREEAGGVDLVCKADRYRLRQVFRNLLDNALAAGTQGVVIRCSEAELEGHPAVQVAVCDDGPGFAPGQSSQLFEPFYTTRVHGTGLGLAICKRIVEAHGGRITAGSGTAPGAEVVVTLPRRGT